MTPCGQGFPKGARFRPISDLQPPPAFLYTEVPSAAAFRLPSRLPHSSPEKPHTQRAQVLPPQSLSGCFRRLSPLCPTPLPPRLLVLPRRPKPLPALLKLTLSRWVTCGHEKLPTPASTVEPWGLTVFIPKAFPEPPRPEASVSTRKTGNRLWAEAFVLRQMPSGSCSSGTSLTFPFVVPACLGT